MMSTIDIAVTGHRSEFNTTNKAALNYSGTTNTPNDSVEPICELSTLQCRHLIVESNNSFKQWAEVDAPSCMGVNCNHSISYWEICSTALSIVMRAIAVCINIKLAANYYRQGHLDYFAWTITCIAVPMFVTTMIHANMCYKDGKFSEGACRILQTLWLVIVSSFFFRYWKSLINYKLNIREESDVAFIRLFECFLEAAPQKILQVSIVLGHVDKMTDLQIIAISSYFGSMAWCLSAYHRYNRYSQGDKFNISINGVILQLCWHFCTSVSRTLCIALVASIFPLWTLVASLSHALLFGFITFIIERPKFANSSLSNFLFCLVLGFVYVFTFISVRDAPTRYKYISYYLFCTIENIACVTLFILYASSDLAAIALLFYPLCGLALSFYYIGIGFMIIYYLYFHPRITARTSKRIINNN
uniref:XK-related protein n=1 Tax=Glossina morsitans morsitans TaxID=37546 RepID=A0A1B0FI26_GLOMM